MMARKADPWGSAGARWGAYLGVIAGALGWMLGFTVVCWTSGHVDVWSRFALPGFALSLAVAGVVLASLELALRVFGPGTDFQLLLWTELTLFGGTLLLLINHWIAPIVESSPGMMETIRSLGGIVRTGEHVPTALLVASVVLGGAFLRRMAREGEPGSGRP